MAEQVQFEKQLNKGNKYAWVFLILTGVFALVVLVGMLFLAGVFR